VLTWPYLIKPIEYSPNHSVLCHVKTLWFSHTIYFKPY
jgi:hypothetical protein